MVDIAANVASYLRDRSRDERAASFDYCFNYFQSYRPHDLTTLAEPENLEASCLHLGYYLASWGMLRGSTVLHTKSYRFFIPVIKTIAAEPAAIWDIDVDRYDDHTIDALLDLIERIRSAITAKPSGDELAKIPTNTLVTKVILGVFGSVPAFDTFFCRGLRSVTGKPVRLNVPTLLAVANFYSANARAIDRERVRTLDFASDHLTGLRYPRAKVIDMVFLIEGGGS
ncbi:MAG: hypothetical protein ACRDZR_00080 [Acidimicrobiales bacterium]